MVNIEMHFNTHIRPGKGGVKGFWRGCGGVRRWLWGVGRWFLGSWEVVVEVVVGELEDGYGGDCEGDRRWL